MSSGRPETGVGGFFCIFRSTMWEYELSIWTQLLSIHRDFHLRPIISQIIVWLIASLLVILDERCILPGKQMYFTIIISEMDFIFPYWTGGPVPFAVVSRWFVCWRFPGMKLRILLQIWPVVELAQTKNIESVSKGTWILSCSTSASVKLVVNP